MQRIGPYQLVRPLGRGGMAEVWMGRREMVGGASKTVAIKLLASKLVNDPTFHRMFLAEARLSMLLNHSNIVQVFDVDMHDGAYYMAMEWVDGMNLSELTRHLAKCGERLPATVSAYIIAEVLRALAYAHTLTHDGEQSGIVHRDVSPQNVMLSLSGEVKLMDFGIARLSTEETSGVHVKGKLRYMPPEQLRRNARRPTVDLFAVGAILHELLDGRPFRSQVVDEARLYGMILDGEVPTLALPSSMVISAELEQLRSGLLTANDEVRIPTAKDALRMLYSSPDYRNSSIEIEELVRRFVGASAPRTGAGLKANTGGTQIAVPISMSPEESGSESTTKRSHSAVDQAVIDTTMRLRDRPLEHLVSPRMWAGVFGGVGISLFVVGLGAAFGWRGPTNDEESGNSRKPSVPIASLTTDRSDELQPTPEQPEDIGAAEPSQDDSEPTLAPASPQPQPEPKRPEPDPTLPAANDEGLENQPSDEISPPATKPATKPSSPTPTVDVVLAANDYISAEVKIGNRVHKLTPLARTSLRPGTYPVQLRESSGDPWVAAGKLSIVAGTSYRVEMLDPPGIKVVKK